MVTSILRHAFGLIAVLLGLATLTFSYRGLIDGAADLSQAFTGSVSLAAVTVYFLIFLCVVTLRYLLLLLFSFLEHIDYFVGLPSGVGSERRQPPRVSIVVPAFNEERVIKGAIASLLDLDYPNYEVIVVDDGSTDDTYDRAREMIGKANHCELRVLTKANGGKADALNTGIANARGELILAMDGDTRLSRNALKLCSRHFYDWRVGAVAGNVKVLNRVNAVTWLQALEYIEGLGMVRRAQSFVRSVSIVPGPLGMFRRSALVEVGSYDTDTFAEDCDLTLKLLLNGWHIVYEPEAVAWAESPSHLLDLLKQRYRWTRGILQAIHKHWRSLFSPRSAGVNCFILWYMLFESVLWPISNVMANLFFVYVGLYYGISVFLLYWWVQLLLLDVIAAFYCLIIEQEDLKLIIVAPLFRLFYVTVVDVAKLFASIEEWAGLSMIWGKLEREGRL